MKGIVLAGGTGSRLHPLTKVTNKHLLPVFNKPMIYYPLYTLKKAGITNVLIVSGRGHAGDFLELLGSGTNLGMKLSYEVQEEAGGIAQALGLARNFAASDKVAVILGDNIIEDDLTEDIQSFENSDHGAKIFLKSVNNPESYGVAFVNGQNIEKIIEKPLSPSSDLAVVGAYFYDNDVFSIIKTLKPSDRNELEITDVNNYYLQKGILSYKKLEGFWGDCGESFESLLDAGTKVHDSDLKKINSNLDL